MTHEFDGPRARKLRKLAKIWRSIARRHLSRDAATMIAVWQAENAWMRQAQANAEHVDNDGESDP